MNIREHLYLSSNRLTLWRAGKDAIRNGEFFEMWVIREIWQVGDDTCVQLASLVWHQVKAVEAWPEWWQKFLASEIRRFFFNARRFTCPTMRCSKKVKASDLFFFAFGEQKSEHFEQKTFKKHYVTV